MRNSIQNANRVVAPSVSPYLLRPLRTYEQALADIAANRTRKHNVTPFITPDSVEYKKLKERVAA